MNKAALFSLSALVAIACAAPTSEEPDYGDGDGDGAGSGGVAAGSGGLVLGSSGGAPPAGSSGGAPPAGSSGGAPPVGSGGTPAASGGAPPIGASCSATGFTVTAGYADNGQMCGFAWTAKFPPADATVTITPPCALGDGTDCFTGADLCTTATVPPSTETPAYYPGVIIGWNAAQAMGGTNSSWTATGTGLTPTFTSTGTGEVRVVIKSGASEYCAVATSGSPIPWASFKVECWDMTSVASFSAGMPISEVMLQLNAGATAQTDVDFCLGGIAVN